MLFSTSNHKHTMQRNSYPPPMIVTSPDTTTHTIICLHGLGSNGEAFANKLLESASLSKRLPTVKFVFPTASKRRSTIFKRKLVNQWYDSYSFEDPNRRLDLQIRGLSESARFVRGLIMQEAELLGEDGYDRIILWGLSQGCAMGIFSVLGGFLDYMDCGVQRIGAFIGMSGWLPFELELREGLEEGPDGEFWAMDNESLSGTEVGLGSDWSSDESDGNEEISAFSSDSSEESEGEEGSNVSVHSDPETSCSYLDGDFDPDFDLHSEIKVLKELTISDDKPSQFAGTYRAVNQIRDILDLPDLKEEKGEKQSRPSNLQHLEIPLFIGHGLDDQKISVELGRKMFQVLTDGFNMKVTWNEYPGLGHWYRVKDEIEDILSFLHEHLGIRVD